MRIARATKVANFLHEHFHVEIAGVFLAEVLWQRPITPVLPLANSPPIVPRHYPRKVLWTPAAAEPCRAPQSSAEPRKPSKRTPQYSERQISEKLEKVGTVDFKRHTTQKVGTRFRQCRPKVPGRFAFPGARSPRIYSTSRSRKHFPAISPGLSRSFPREPPNRPRKQPQPSRVFWKFPQGPAEGCDLGW